MGLGLTGMAGDVAFLVAMYIGVTISLILAYGLTRLVGGRNE